MVPKEICKTPKVSVCVVTYNQEKYIRECLQSIVDQETDFDFEVIIGDDCSTDGTTGIVEEFINKYSGKVKALIHKKNVGPAVNYCKTHALATGKYVAHLDGDDCALQGKLQAQYEALEKNKSCVMSTHDMMVCDKSGNVRSRTYKKHKEGVGSIWDLYETLPFFAHSSKMIRGDIDKNILKAVDADTVDIDLHVEALLKGGVYHIAQPLGVYRVGVGITAASASEVHKKLISATDRIYRNALESFANRKRLKFFYARAILKYAYQAAVLGNSTQANALAMKSVRIKTFSIGQVFFYWLSFFHGLLIFFANVRRLLKNK